MRRLLEDGGQPEAAVAALWALHHLKAADAAVLNQALRHQHAAVRKNALQVAQVTGNDSIQQALLKSLEAPEARVRLEAILAVGERRGVDGGRAPAIVRHD